MDDDLIFAIIGWSGIAGAALLLIIAPVMLRRGKLKPGRCECGHIRCNHVKGRNQCSALIWGHDYNTLCNCRIYIPRDEDHGGGDAPTPTPNELESLYRLN